MIETKTSIKDQLNSIATLDLVETEDEEEPQALQLDTELLIDIADLIKEFGFVRIKIPHNIQLEELITPEGKELIAANFEDFAS